MTIVGTRPEVIRLSRVISKLDEYTSHVLVHTGQNYDYELNQVFFDDLGIRQPDYFLGVAAQSVAETIGQIIVEADRVLASEEPDALLVLGDTNSCLSVLPAKRRKIPVFHMEAGNRCFDQRVPEEINRRIVDHTADINLPYSSIAREYLLREGIPPDSVVKTGSPMSEVLQYSKEGIQKSDVLTRMSLKAGSFFLVSAHREENVDNRRSLLQLGQILNRIAETYDAPVVVSTHPRTRNRIETEGLEFDHRVRLSKPLGYFDYVKLQKSAKAVLSDSGTITEEASLLGIPALNLREVHERPEGMEEASVMLVGLSVDRVMQALEILDDQSSAGLERFRTPSDYSVNNVSDKVVRIVLSYTDFVRRTVWKRYDI